MASLETARYGAQANVREMDYRIWSEEVLPSPVGRLVPLPPPLVRLIRSGVRYIVRGFEYELEAIETLLHYVLEIDWARTRGYLWWDYYSDTFSPIIPHPIGRDDGKAYEAKPLLANPPSVPRQAVPDYYPQAIGFHGDCLKPPEETTALMAVPTSVVLMALVRAVATAPEEDALKVSMASVISLPIPPVPVIPKEITEAFDAVKGVCKSVGLVDPIGIAKALNAAQAWACCALRYQSLVQRNQNVEILWQLYWRRILTFFRRVCPLT